MADTPKTDRKRQAVRVNIPVTLSADLYDRVVCRVERTGTPLPILLAAYMIAMHNDKCAEDGQGQIVRVPENPAWSRGRGR